MSVFFSAILSDLTSRSVSFLIDKCLTMAAAAPAVEETLNSLQRLLHRAHVIVEESQERIVTNQAMLRQLNRLQKEMYRAYHTLDTLRCKAPDADGDDHNLIAAGRSFKTSRINPANRLRSRGGSSSSEHERAIQVLGDLETTMRDVRELVVFLSGCPRLCRQPYSVHLLVGKCMFNRQMEMEHVMEFLLRSCDEEEETPAVLPIIGPGRVGKTTIIEHACNDQRVRSHFSQILRFSQDGLRDVKTIPTLGDCSVIKLILDDDHAFRGEKMTTLVIIEVVGDIDQGVWEKLYSDCRHQIGRGSKILVASRSDKIARLGRATQTQPLTVRSFTEEEYWYFFKARMFGSTDIKDHPKVAAIAMDLAREMHMCFFGASLFGRLLKANFDARIWSRALAMLREFIRINILLYGVVDIWQLEDPLFVRRTNNTSSECFVILDDYQTVSVEEESGPSSEGTQMSILDLFFGENNVRPRGRFNVLAYRSHIPPHYSYVVTCEVQRQHGVFSRKKRSIQHVAS
ncbi:hypothetical protein HU200_015712 [Digitaria exilis]|uniref:NB-ARC domain-containing protein n=1 Tax=Digitaria exilis TaxID=1010633 RepID=A0A835KL75_9POAL|nr:hypothetical protein HU200_015712 [Digitaria exilis]